MSDIKENVIEALKSIQPYLQAHGGDVELVDVVDNIVKVKLQGACSGCPGATQTLKMGVERIIKEKVPEITAVEAIGI